MKLPPISELNGLSAFLLMHRITVLCDNLSVRGEGQELLRGNKVTF